MVGTLRLAGYRLEGASGEDLNGDGDAEDRVLHVYDLEAAETRNVGLTPKARSGGGGRRFPPPQVSGKWLVFVTAGSAGSFHVYDLEAAETKDLGLLGSVALSGKWLAFVGEGGVLHVYDLESAETTKLAIAGPVETLSGKWLVFEVSEVAEGGDLNGDGDAEDVSVLHVYNLESAQTTNLELAAGLFPHVLLSGEWLSVRGLGTPPASGPQRRRRPLGRSSPRA